MAESVGGTHIVGARVTPEERGHLDRLAKIHDRTPSREVHRAIRFYLAHYDEADRFLRDEADAGVDS